MITIPESIDAGDLAGQLRWASETGRIPWHLPPEEVWEMMQIPCPAWEEWSTIGWWGPLDPWFRAGQRVRSVHINPDRIIRVHGDIPTVDATPIHRGWVQWIQSRCLGEVGWLNPRHPTRWVVAGNEVHVIETSLLDRPNRRRIRVSLTKPPYTPDGETITMRMIESLGWSLDQLIAAGTISAEAAALLRIMVERHCTIVIGGATGSGKTTLMSALLDVVNQVDRRVILIEDTRELPPPKNGFSVDVSGDPDRYRGCLRHALRQDPDVIVVGEIRGDEALTVLEAASSGHPAMATIHATGTARCIGRLLELAVARGESPAEYVQRTIAGGAFPLILVFMQDRRVIEIAEVVVRSNIRLSETIPLNPLFVWRDGEGLVRQYPPQGTWFYHDRG